VKKLQFVVDNQHTYPTSLAELIKDNDGLTDKDIDSISSLNVGEHTYIGVVKVECIDLMKIDFSQFKDSELQRVYHPLINKGPIPMTAVNEWNSRGLPHWRTGYDYFLKEKEGNFILQ
jgi:hypothetical protein